MPSGIRVSSGTHLELCVVFLFMCIGKIGLILFREMRCSPYRTKQHSKHNAVMRCVAQAFWHRQKGKPYQTKVKIKKRSLYSGKKYNEVTKSELSTFRFCRRKFLLTLVVKSHDHMKFICPHFCKALILIQSSLLRRPPLHLSQTTTFLL